MANDKVSRTRVDAAPVEERKAPVGEETMEMVRKADGNVVRCKPMHVAAWEAEGYEKK